MRSFNTFLPWQPSREIDGRSAAESSLEGDYLEPLSEQERRAKRSTDRPQRVTNAKTELQDGAFDNARNPTPLRPLRSPLAIDCPNESRDTTMESLFNESPAQRVSGP